VGQVADALKKLLENSEDLSSLPQLIAQVDKIEGSETDYQQRISQLQEINRNYLSQIPIPGDNPHQQPDTPQEPTLEDAKQALINVLGGNK
jgi:hypothetical protein